MKIYASFCKEDFGVVGTILGLLRNQGIELLNGDRSTVEIGESFAEIITENISRADYMLFFHSSNANHSPWVTREVEYSRSLGKCILTIKIDDSDFSPLFEDVLDKTSYIELPESRLSPCLDSIEFISDVLSVLLCEVDPHNPRIRHIGLQDTFYSMPCGVPRPCPSPAPSYAQSPASHATKPRLLIFVFVAIFVIAISVVILEMTLFAPLYCCKVNPDCSEPFLPPEYSSDTVGVSVPETGRVSSADYACYAPPASSSDTLDAYSVPEVGRGNSAGSVCYEPSASSQDTLGVCSVPEVGRGNSADSVFYEPSASSQDTWTDESFSYPDDDLISDSKSQYGWLVHVGVTALIVFLGAVVFVRKRNRVYVVKLSGNFISKLSIDGQPVVDALAPYQVYMLRLKAGQYIVDFQSLDNKEYHKVFSLLVGKNGDNYLFAEVDREKCYVKDNEIKIFIAGSLELERERDALRSVISMMYNKWQSHQFKILSYTFEDFPSKFQTDSSKQDQIDAFIENESDWVVFVVDNHIGGITKDEFDIAVAAHKKHKETGHPNILVLSNKLSEDDACDDSAIADIRKQVIAEKQYWTSYSTINELKSIFASTLNWDLIEMVSRA